MNKNIIDNVSKIKNVNEILTSEGRDNGELLRQLYSQMLKNAKMIRDIDDMNIVYSYLARNYLIGDITPDIGSTYYECIKLCNILDRGIPVEKRKPIWLSIDSDGGDLEATFTIIDAIEMSTTPVYTYNIGNAYSGGFFIFINGHKRFSTPRARFMFHEGSIGVGGMDTHKFRNYADFYDKELDMLKKMTIEKSNMTEEQYRAIQKDDYWLTVPEAIEIGIVDKVVTSFEEVI